MANREAFFLDGKKQRVKTIEDAVELVRKVYPKATRNGSVGCWSWSQQENGREWIVAEAWAINGATNDWWLKIAKTPKCLD